MACLHLIKHRPISYVQIFKSFKKLDYSHTSLIYNHSSKIDQLPIYVRAIAELKLYNNTILILDKLVKNGIGIYFKSTTH